MAFPGMPGMDMNALQALMSDPAIQQMTEALTKDPEFMKIAAEMQTALLSGEMGGMNLGGEGGAPAMDPSSMMNAFSKVMENPEFMAAAENIGKTMMSNSMDAESLAMLELFQNPANAEKLKAKMEDLKSDPVLGDMIKDIEENGNAAMMKYMNDAEKMSLMGKKFQEAMQDEDWVKSLAKPDGAEEEEEEEEEGEEPGKETTVISAASNGSLDRLKELLKEGAKADEADEEGRTALHFASGYGELDCMQALLDAGADINAVDENKNSALHYAAGYGNEDSVKLLKEKGADLSLKNAEEKTAKEVAEMNEQEDVVKLL